MSGQMPLDEEGQSISENDLRALVIGLVEEIIKWCHRSLKSQQYFSDIYKALAASRSELYVEPKSWNPYREGFWGAALGFKTDYPSYKRFDTEKSSNAHKIGDRQISNIRVGIKAFGILSTVPRYNSSRESWKSFLTESIRLIRAQDIPTEIQKDNFDEKDDEKLLSSRTVLPVDREPKEIKFVTNIPLLSNHHLRITALVEKLRTRLVDGKRVMVIAALHGMRGVGKSSFAIEYANTYKDDYRVRWWINAETQHGMISGLSALGVRLGWIAENENGSEARKKILDGLAALREDTLIIFDNVVNRSKLDGYLPPSSKAHIVITSNSPFWGSDIGTLSVETWTDAMGADFLLRRVQNPNNTREQAEALSRRLGGLALALEQAAVYCEKSKSSFERYINLFEEMPLDFLEDIDDVASNYHNLEHRNLRTIAGTFFLAIGMAAQNAAGAPKHAVWPLIKLVSQLPSEVVPTDLIELGGKAGIFSDRLKGRSLDKAISALADWSLAYVEYVPDERLYNIRTRCVRLHRLVREVVALKNPDQNPPLRKALLKALAAQFPKNVYTDSRVWPWARSLLIHAQNVATEDQEVTEKDNETRIELLNRIADYHHGAANSYDQSAKLFGTALDISTRLTDRVRPSVANTYHGLAWVHATIGQYRKAKELFLKGLAIRKRCLPLHHIDMVESYHRIGWVCVYLADYRRSETFIRRACQIYESLPAEEAAEYHCPWGSLGWLYTSIGKYEESLQYYEKSRETMRRIYGPNNAVLANSTNSIGLIHIYLGNLDEASQELKRAWKLRNRALGKRHSEFGSSLHSLGLLCMAQKNYSWAARYFERALEIWSPALTPEHLRTARALASLAEVALLRDQPETARQLALRSYDIRQRLLARRQPDRAHSEWLLAHIYEKAGQGDRAEAENFAYLAVINLERSVTDGHVWLKAARATLANIQARIR